MDRNIVNAFVRKMLINEHKDRLAKCLLLFVVLAAVVTSSAAQTLRTTFAQSGESRQTELTNEFSAAMSGVALNESTFVYFARSNNIEGLYSFDIETTEVRLLMEISIISAGATFVGPEWDGRSHATGRGLVLLSAGGMLYATDGTPNGTRFIRDFGFYVCCGNFPSNFSRLNSIQYLNGKFYISVGGVDERREIWISDGTIAGTKRIAFGDSRAAPGPFFNGSINGENSVLYIERFSSPAASVGLEIGLERLLKLDEDGSITLIHEFEMGISLRSFFDYSTQNSNGTYLCGREIDSETGREIPGEGSLWRISNNGSVSIIERGGCRGSTLASNSGRIYYFSNQGLKSTTGIAGTARTEIVSTDDVDDVCAISNSLYYPISESEIVEVNSGSIREVGVRDLKGDVRTITVPICAQSKMVVRASVFGSVVGDSVFDTSNDSFARVRNLGFAARSSDVLENSLGELFGFASLSTFRSPSRIIKISSTQTVLPQLMLLLDSQLQN